MVRRLELARRLTLEIERCWDSVVGDELSYTAQNGNRSGTSECGCCTGYSEQLYDSTPTREAVILMVMSKSRDAMTDDDDDEVSPEYFK